MRLVSLNQYYTFTNEVMGFAAKGSSHAQDCPLIQALCPYHERNTNILSTTINIGLFCLIFSFPFLLLLSLRAIRLLHIEQ